MPTPPPNPFLADEASTALAIPSLFDLFFLPGDWAIYWVARYLPAVAEWLGLGPEAYGTSVSAVASSVTWLVTFIGLIILWASIRNLDRAVTRGIAAGYADVRRRIRIVVVLASYRRRQRVKRTEPTIIVEEIDPRGLRASSSSHLYE